MNLHVFLSPFTHESRCLKESRSLVAAGLVDEVLFVGVGEPGLAEHEAIDERRRVWRVPLSSRKLPRRLFSQGFKYLEWLGRVLWAARRWRVEVVHVHSLVALPLGVALKLLGRGRLVYDAHELETETNGTHGARKRLKQWLERALIGQADATLVVSEAIADWYARAYALPRPLVVRNVPDVPAGWVPPASSLLRERFGLAPDDLLFIYQGALSPGRGVERLLRVFPRVGPQRHLVLMGYGSLEEAVRQAAAAHPNLHFMPAVPPDQVLAHTASADVGIILGADTCLSYHLSLPNKFWEYAMAGLAIFSGDFPEQLGVLARCGCGWQVPDDDEAFIQAIDALTPAQVAEKRANSRLAREGVSWEREAAPMLEAYRALRPSGA